MQRIPGIHNLTAAVMWEQARDMTALGLCDALEIGLANSIIINTLGDKFWSNECTTFGKKQSFFHKKSDVKIVNLANMLWELKDTVGFIDLLNRIMKDDFESAYYELYCASQFKSIAKDVELIIPSGKRGMDFDLKVTGYQQYDILNVEVKCRTEVFKDTKRVKDFLSNAKGQLPKNDSNAIMFKLKFGNGSISQTDLDNVIVNFVKNSNRMDFVVYIWDSSQFDNSIWMTYVGINAEGRMGEFLPKRVSITPSFVRDAELWGLSQKPTA